MTFKFDGWPRKAIGHLLYNSKLCASFQIHQWIQTAVTVRKHSFRGIIDDFLSRVTLKFDGWGWKIIGRRFYVTSSFVHYFVVIGEFKLELQYGNTQFGAKSTSFWAVWPRNLTDDIENNRLLFFATSSFVHHFVAIGAFKLELRSGNG